MHRTRRVHLRRSWLSPLSTTPTTTTAAAPNSGGVDVTATFSGTNGYDVYVGADAVGNSVTGYACSDCEGYLEARNTQTNNGDISAAANTTVAGSTRAVITGANAVGNAATFHVSRPAH